MNTVLNLKAAAWILAVSSAAFLLLFGWLLNRDLSNPFQVLATAPLVLSADLVLVFLFTQWLWKLTLFKGWLVVVPDLRGTWHGEIRPSATDDTTGKSVPPIPSFLTINQTLFRISCVIRSGEMKSFSFLAGFLLNKERQEKVLCYSYDSTPRPSVRHRSAPHQGTALLEIEEGNSLRLSGEYWTARRTTGEMTFTRTTKSLEVPRESDLSSHPMNLTAE